MFTRTMMKPYAVAAGLVLMLILGIASVSAQQESSNRSRTSARKTSRTTQEEPAVSVSRQTQTGMEDDSAVAGAGQSIRKAVASAGRDTGNDPEAISLLRKIEQQYASVQAISGQFTQVRQDPAFQEKTESQARFWLLKPSNFRADYQEPNASTNLITGEYFYRFIPELKQVERYHFQNQENTRDLNYMLLGFGEKTEVILRVYQAKLMKEAPAPYNGLKLVPKDAKNSNFRWISLLVTTDGKYVPAQFSMEQLDGVRTTANLDLQTLKIGAKIDQRVFQPSFKGSPQIVDIE